MVDMSELTESVKGYIEGLQDVLQKMYDEIRSELMESIKEN